MFGDIKVFTYGVNKYKTEDVFIFMANNPWVLWENLFLKITL